MNIQEFLQPPERLRASVVKRINRMEDMHKQRAVLLLGATGTGKTPFGEYMEEKGFEGKRCFHFDFGENLRKAAAGGFHDGLVSDENVAFLKEVLEHGKLLEDDKFHIAENILRSFVQERGVTQNDIVIMNGLPRHVGQADDVESIVDIQMVIHLDCTAETVFERIEKNSGGDRTERDDDSFLHVSNKIALFNERTILLLDHYRAKNVRVVAVGVGTETGPDDILQGLG